MNPLPEPIKIFVSLPMSGLTDEEIRKRQKDIFCKYLEVSKNIHNRILSHEFDERNFVLVNSILTDEDVNPSKFGRNVGAYCLGESIKMMADSALVIFANGWEQARGCRLEYQVADAYLMVTMTEKELDKDIEREKLNGSN